MYSRLSNGTNQNQFGRNPNQKPMLFLSRRYSKYTWRETFISCYGNDKVSGLSAKEWEAWDNDSEWFHRYGIKPSTIVSELAFV